MGLIVYTVHSGSENNDNNSVVALIHYIHTVCKCNNNGDNSKEGDAGASRGISGDADCVYKFFRGGAKNEDGRGDFFSIPGAFS